MSGVIGVALLGVVVIVLVKKHKDKRAAYEAAAAGTPGGKKRSKKGKMKAHSTYSQLIPPVSGADTATPEAKAGHVQPRGGDAVFDIDFEDEDEEFDLNPSPKARAGNGYSPWQPRSSDDNSNGKKLGLPTVQQATVNPADASAKVSQEQLATTVTAPDSDVYNPAPAAVKKFSYGKPSSTVTGSALPPAAGRQPSPADDLFGFLATPADDRAPSRASSNADAGKVVGPSKSKRASPVIVTVTPQESPSPNVPVSAQASPGSPRRGSVMRTVAGAPVLLPSRRGSSVASQSSSGSSASGAVSVPGQRYGPTANVPLSPFLQSPASPRGGTGLTAPSSGAFNSPKASQANAFTFSAAGGTDGPTAGGGAPLSKDSAAYLARFLPNGGASPSKRGGGGDRAESSDDSNDDDDGIAMITVSKPMQSSKLVPLTPVNSASKPKPAPMAVTVKLDLPAAKPAAASGKSAPKTPSPSFDDDNLDSLLAM